MEAGSIETEFRVHLETGCSQFPDSGQWTLHHGCRIIQDVQPADTAACLMTGRWQDWTWRWPLACPGQLHR